MLLPHALPLALSAARSVRRCGAARPSRLLWGGAGMLAGLASTLLGGSADCDGGAPPPPPVPARVESVSKRQLREAMESGALPAIVSFGGVAIVGMLLLAWRTERRSSRASAFVALSNSVLNRSPAVVNRVGRIASSGTYQLTFEPERVEGWYVLEAAARRLKGVAHVSAVKSSSSSSGPASGGGWDIQALRVEFDRESLQLSDAKRAAMAAAAGYRRADEVEAATAAAAAGDVHTGDKDERVVIRAM